MPKNDFENENQSQATEMTSNLYKIIVIIDFKSRFEIFRFEMLFRAMSIVQTREIKRQYFLLQVSLLYSQ